MITRITGILDRLSASSAEITLANGLTYEVLLSSFAVARLGGLLEQEVTLHTLEYIESQSQGATMFPRLAGFLSPQDRAFFQLFTSVRGLGYRKSLRAMALATEQIAAAIAERDVSLLQSLPEIGKRTAETIIATLRGKVDPFVGGGAGAGGGATAGEQDQPAGPVTGMSREALEALVALGENRVQAMRWIDEVLRRTEEEERPTSTDELIARVYQLKSGG